MILVILNVAEIFLHRYVVNFNHGDL